MSIKHSFMLLIHLITWRLEAQRMLDTLQKTFKEAPFELLKTWTSILSLNFVL